MNDCEVIAMDADKKITSRFSGELCTKEVKALIDELDCMDDTNRLLPTRPNVVAYVTHATGRSYIYTIIYIHGRYEQC